MPDSQLADDFLPAYDVSDAVATVTSADREAAWQALLDVDLLKLGREAPLVGLAGRFSRPVIEFARIGSAAEFREFEEPGFAKTVYDLTVRELDSNRTLLSGVMRTATTDEHARRWFRRYWTFGVGSGAHILVGALLDSARRAAEGGPET